MGLYTIPPTDLFNAFSETLGVWYDYVTLGFDLIGSGPSACGTLAVSPIIDLTGRPGESFFHLVQRPLGVFTIGKNYPETFHFFLEELRTAAECFGLIGEGTNDTIFAAR